MKKIMHSFQCFLTRIPTWLMLAVKKKKKREIVITSPVRHSGLTTVIFHGDCVHSLHADSILAISDAKLTFVSTINSSAVSVAFAKNVRCWRHKYTCSVVEVDGYFVNYESCGGR